MGTFANSMFSGMLSWFRSAVNWVWNTLVGTENASLIHWLGQNWLGLVLALCVVCMLVDGLVCLLRWRPDRVWASFFRRVLHRDDHQDTAGYASGRLRREWHYADGTACTEEIEIPQEEWPQPEEIVPINELSPEYIQNFVRPENLKYQEELKKEQPTGLEDYPQPMHTSHHRRIKNRTDRLQTRMARLREHLSEPEELELRYRPAPPAVDKRQAYHEPYIPPQWRKPANIGASQEENVHEHAF